MSKSIRIFLLGFVLLLCSGARAAISPLSVSVLAPVQFPPGDFSVTGARVSAFWGHHRDVYGLDFGVIGNITDQDFVGLAISGIFNITHGTTTILGLQAAGVTNVNTNKTNIFGAQIALAINSNQASSSVTGLQAAILGNLAAHTDIYGAQVGLYNRAQSVYGFQIGLINDTDSLHGIQIGLLNFNRKGLFAVSPILNIGF
jgi:hypothetical protein